MEDMLRDKIESYKVKTYCELEEALKNASLKEDAAVIYIEDDITLKKTIEAEGLKNVTITSEKGSALLGGKVFHKWDREGEFLSLRTETEPRVLIVNGVLCPKSTYPEEGCILVKDVTDIRWMDSRNGGWNRPLNEEELTHATVDPSEIPEELDINNCDMRILHIWDESTVAVKAFDRKNGVITTQYPMAHPAGAFRIMDNDKGRVIACRFLNTKYGLTKPGSWCYDRTEKKIYYLPLDGQSEENTEAMVPVSTSLLKLKNCSHVVVENLKLFLSNAECGQIAGLRAVNPSGAIQVEDSQDITLNMLDISYSGGQGIKVLRSKRIAVENCVVHKCASCGILTFECEDERIAYNELRDIGMYDLSAIPIHAGGKSLLVFVQDGRIPEKGQTIIEYNTIDRAPYCGITCNGGPHIIRNNKLTRCMLELDDGSAIYCSRAEGTLVKDNFISDIPGNKKANAVYFDEFSEDSVADGNVSINVKVPFLAHRSKHCTLKNNIMINDGEVWIRIYRASDFTWKNNIVSGTGDIVLECTSLEAGGNDLSKYITFDKDVMYSKNGAVWFWEMDTDNNTIIKEKVNGLNRFQEDENGKY
ncbi:MAG: right-handed parallel beta-helix repeat-containing protein [Lachnospiraceae bacterium]|nr:right-handed parallel beta-helix repeat-containing protein [Lachnospiraceae bacterium]